MNKTLLIFRHEFLHTIKRTGFIIMTLIVPLVALLAIGVFQLISGIVKPPTEVTKIGYVDEAGGFDQFTTQGNITLVRFDIPEAATQSLIKKDINEYFVVPPDFISTGIVSRYTTQKEVTPPATTTAVIKNFISSNLLAGKVSADTIARVEAPLSLVTTTLTSTGAVASEQGGLTNLIIPGIFSLLLALSRHLFRLCAARSWRGERESPYGDFVVLGLDPAVNNRQGFGNWSCRFGTGSRLGDFDSISIEPRFIIYRWLYQYDTDTR
jgi:ABC-2 type transport system permease protein